MALSGNIAVANGSTATLTKFGWLFSAVRCDLCADPSSFGRRPSGYSSPNIRTSAGLPTAMSFTTYARSHIVNQVQALYVLGYPGHAGGPCPTGLDFCGYLDAANSVGLADADVILYSTAMTTPDAVFTVLNTVSSPTMTTVDQIILPNAKISGGLSTWGLACDCEADDHSLASDILVQQTQMANIVHNSGFKYASGADNVLGTGQIGGFCGVSATAPNCDIANLAAIANVVDIFFLLGGTAPSGSTPQQFVSDQLAMFGTVGTYPATVLALNFIMGPWPGGSSVTGATAVRSLLVSAGMGGLTFSPAGAAVGGQQCRYTNIKKAIMMGLDTSPCAPLPP